MSNETFALKKAAHLDSWRVARRIPRYLLVLSANPLSMDPMTIKDIKVMETVVEGKSVYQAAK